MARLRIEFSGTRTEVSLKGGAVTVGRSNRCSINLPDKSLAEEHFHLTARQCGELARAAGVRRLIPFHVSPRYKGREQEVLDEVADSFGGTVVEP